MVRSLGLPRRIRALFWDQATGRLTWKRDGDLIISRVLAEGDGGAVRWLRKQLGDGGLRTWLVNRRGAGLAPAQLRYWELILGLPSRQVTAWLAAPGRTSWDRRRRL
jgi:hypothetical protein